MQDTYLKTEEDADFLDEELLICPSCQSTRIAGKYEARDDNGQFEYVEYCLDCGTTSTE